MASTFISTAVALSLLLTLASAQINPGSFDISAQKGWDKFVEEAAKGTGGTPINMDEFVTRVNNNINNGGGEEANDPELMEELKNFGETNNGLVPVKTETGKSKSVQPESSSEPTSPAAMDDHAAARMIASANGGSLSPENAPLNGAFSIRVVGVVCGLLPVFATYFVL